MAKMQEQYLVVKITKLLKDNDANNEKFVDDDTIKSIEGQLATWFDDAVVEVQSDND